MSDKFDLNDCFFSFVIPCFNEEAFIGSAIESIIYNFREKNIRYEIIVMDNGSSDQSAVIARNGGAKVVNSNAKTVSGVRNEGASLASGTIFVFLDADVKLSENWIDTLVEYCEALRKYKYIVGSHCSVPDNVKGIFREWYLAIEKDIRDTHVGSGHMLIGKELFFQIGGFNSFLVSGEDYDLCRRAREEGAKLVVDCRLKAYHLGYPTTVKEFVNREVWHGLGDVYSIKTFFLSKPAVFATLFYVAQIMILIFLMGGMIKYSVGLFLVAVAMIVGLIVYKFKVISPKSIYFLALPAYLYLTGRFGSLICKVTRKAGH